MNKEVKDSHDEMWFLRLCDAEKTGCGRCVGDGKSGGGTQQVSCRILTGSGWGVRKRGSHQLLPDCASEPNPVAL